MKLDWSILWSGEAGGLILQGLGVTLKLSAWSLLPALAIGLAFGVVRWIGSRWTEPICWLYVELSRNTPPVVQILFWYFSASYILPQWLFLRFRDIGYEFAAAVVALLGMRPLLPEGAASPTSHASAPYEIGQDRQADRPEDDETEDHHGEPGQLSVIVQARRQIHRTLRCECLLH